MFRAMVLAGAMLAAGSFSAQGQELIDGSMVDEIVNLARGYGAASATTLSNGDPVIDGKVDALPYRIIFQNCTNNANCEDVRFFTVFPDVKPTLDQINEWNRDQRWGKAYIDADLDATLEWDVNLVHGVARRNLDNTLTVWTQNMGAFATFIGAQ